MAREDPTHRHGGTVLLHRLSFTPAQADLLVESGIDVERTSSAARICERAAALTGRRIIIVDLGSKSSAPERIHTFLKRLSDPKILLIGCAESLEKRSLRRAKVFGLESVHVFPVEVFTTVVEWFDALPYFSMRPMDGEPAGRDSAAPSRSAPRATLDQPMELDEDGDLDGYLVNISATGALVETNMRATVGARIELQLVVPPKQEPQRISSVVRWVESFGTMHRAGVQFQRLSNDVRRAISAFVARHHIVRGGRAAPRVDMHGTKRAKVQLAGSSRVDYFRLAYRERGDLTLIPKRAFFVPYEPGHQLEVRLLDPCAERELRVQVLRSVTLEPGRLDGKVGWRVRRLSELEEPPEAKRPEVVVTRFT